LETRESSYVLSLQPKSDTNLWKDKRDKHNCSCRSQTFELRDDLSNWANKLYISTF